MVMVILIVIVIVIVMVIVIVVVIVMVIVIVIVIVIVMVIVIVIVIVIIIIMDFCYGQAHGQFLFCSSRETPVSAARELHACAACGREGRGAAQGERKSRKHQSLVGEPFCRRRGALPRASGA